MRLVFFRIYAKTMVFSVSEACKKDIPVGLVDMHDCGMDSKIKMNLGSFFLLKKISSRLLSSCFVYVGDSNAMFSSVFQRPRLWRR